MSKVILLAPIPPPIGGIAAWTVRMMNATLPNDWKVEVVDEKIIGKREFFGDKTKHDIKSEIKRCLGIWSGLIKALRDKEAKVVHACIAANTMPVMREYISAFITKSCGKKFIIHFRCTVPNIVGGRLNVIALKMLCNKADCVMLLNKQSEEYINGITKTRTVVIPNFVDAQEVVESHEIQGSVKRVLYVGGVIESKGCLDIIEVAKSFPDIEFKLIGNPEDVCVKAAESVSNVLLAGTMPHSQIIEEMKRADVFMFLTYFPGEGFSNSLAEAMAAGLPCIVTDWAANKDMIEDKGGVIVPVHDVKAAIKALSGMQNSQVRKKQSMANIEKVKNTYGNKTVQSMYVKCYESLENTYHDVMR